MWGFMVGILWRSENLSCGENRDLFFPPAYDLKDFFKKVQDGGRFMKI